jgi:hypothetical protein
VLAVRPAGELGNGADRDLREPRPRSDGDAVGGGGVAGPHGGSSSRASGAIERSPGLVALVGRGDRRVGRPARRSSRGRRGSGKSRAGSRCFAAYSRSRRAECGRGPRGPDGARASPFGVLAQAIRRGGFFGLREGESAAFVRQKRSARLRRIDSVFRRRTASGSRRVGRRARPGLRFPEDERPALRAPRCSDGGGAGPDGRPKYAGRRTSRDLVGLLRPSVRRSCSSSTDLHWGRSLLEPAVRRRRPADPRRTDRAPGSRSALGRPETGRACSRASGPKRWEGGGGWGGAPGGRGCGPRGGGCRRRLGELSRRAAERLRGATSSPTDRAGARRGRTSTRRASRASSTDAGGNTHSTSRSSLRAGRGGPRRASRPTRCLAMVAGAARGASPRTQRPGAPGRPVVSQGQAFWSGVASRSLPARGGRSRIHRRVLGEHRRPRKLVSGGARGACPGRRRVDLSSLPTRSCAERATRRSRTGPTARSGHRLAGEWLEAS